jgi:lipoprotein-releasing system permease protein
MTGVGLGVWLVLLTLGILGGFEQDLERKIIGAHAHLEAQSPRQTPFAYTPALQARVAQLRQRPELPLVADAVFVAGEVAIASPTQYTAALMSGVDPIRAPDVLGVLGSLDAAALEALEADATSLPTHPPMLIGREMARSLGVRRGDRVRVISPTLEVLSPLGPTPKSRPFVVAGIFASHMYEHDAHSAYVSLPAARRFLELQADQISSIGLQCKEPRDTPLVRQAWDAATAIAAAGAPTAQAAPALRLIDWRERNQTLFAALNLESRVAFVVLIFIVLVASFSIVNTLTMSVLERQRDIAILKAMGAHDVSIVKIFVMQGLLIGGVGTGVGGLLGIGSLAMLQWVGFAIPGDVLYLDSLPVRLQPVQIVGVLAATLVMVWNFSIVPSLRGAAVLPAEGLRDG